VEDLSEVYTIEVNHPEPLGWEVHVNAYSVYSAIEIFRAMALAGIECRITSPAERVLRKRLGLEVV